MLVQRWDALVSLSCQEQEKAHFWKKVKRIELPAAIALATIAAISLILTFQPIRSLAVLSSFAPYIAIATIVTLLSSRQIHAAIDYRQKTSEELAERTQYLSNIRHSNNGNKSTIRSDDSFMHAHISYQERVVEAIINKYNECKGFPDKSSQSVIAQDLICAKAHWFFLQAMKYEIETQKVDPEQETSLFARAFKKHGLYLEKGLEDYAAVSSSIEDTGVFHCVIRFRNNEEIKINFADGGILRNGANFTISHRYSQSGWLSVAANILSCTKTASLVEENI